MASAVGMLIRCVDQDILKLNLIYRGGPEQPASSSPLQHFVQAKKKINEIFIEVDGYVSETENFLASVPKETEVASEEVYEAAKEFGKVVRR